MSTLFSFPSKNQLNAQGAVTENPGSLPCVSSVECIWIRIIRKHHKPLVIGSVYRPPSADSQYYDNMVDVIDHCK